jgi:hypothetical protein
LHVAHATRRFGDLLGQTFRPAIGHRAFQGDLCTLDPNSIPLASSCPCSVSSSQTSSYTLIGRW